MAGVLAQWGLWDCFSPRPKVREASTNRESARDEAGKFQSAVDLEEEQARLDRQPAA